MFVTVLSNAYSASSQDETTHNVTGLATSTNGQTWTWAGIVVGQDNGYDNQGAWSPSAMVVGNDISLWYNTSDSEVLHSTLNSSAHLQSTQACLVNGQPLHLVNISVAEAPDGLFWMLGQTYDDPHAAIIQAYTSSDGINWSPWNINGDANLIVSSGAPTSLLTSVIDYVGNSDLVVGFTSNPSGYGSYTQQTVTLHFHDAVDPVQHFYVVDTKTNQILDGAGEAYSGPMDYLQVEYGAPSVTPDTLNITASSPNAFLVGGTGGDALETSSGTNVINGGTGSNFLVGTKLGLGTDTFFLDFRPDIETWSSVVNFHTGDSLTIWDVSPTADLVWQDNEGASGYTGATLHIYGNNNLITLTGWSISSAIEPGGILRYKRWPYIYSLFSKLD